jgi:hypothetical protein
VELVGATINAAVVAVVGAVLAWFAEGRFNGLDHRIDRLEGRLDGRIDRLEASVNALRSDLTQVALAVGVRPRAQND